MLVKDSALFKTTVAVEADGFVTVNEFVEKFMILVGLEIRTGPLLTARVDEPPPPPPEADGLDT